MNEVKSFFRSRGFQRFLVLIIVALVLYALKSMINLILITFILTFLMDRFQRFISRKLKVNRKIVIACLYIILVSFIGTTLYKYLPVLTIQISQLIYQFKLFFQNPPDNEIVKYVLSTINGMEVSKYIEQGVDVIYQSIANIGKVSLQILLSLILSLFFLLEKERIITFTSKFKGNYSASSRRLFSFTSLICIFCVNTRYIRLGGDRCVEKTRYSSCLSKGTTGYLRFRS
ncbi:hypothetical protein CT43_CH1872 [Bacillus thuringiensis serovar chinensis CT-43]|nr:hypothetical protein CT43_CH1872 [Bacillus thuringiensis serovar chinensis CT-43]